MLRLMFLAQSNFFMRANLTLLTCLAIAAPALHGVEAPRPMSTDRPDQTESAYTVPKGWFQMEANLFSFTRTLGQSGHTEEASWGDFLFKYGLTQKMDLELGWQPHLTSREKDAAGLLTQERQGRGDMLLRLKINHLGNDTGAYALATMPWVKIPTASSGLGNDTWEYGLTVNQSLDIGGGWELGSSLFLAMAAVGNQQHYFEPAFTLALGRDLTERLGFYIETYQGWHKDDSRYWQCSLDGGFTFMLTENVQFDIGVNWYFNGQKALNPFSGISFRF